MHLTRSNFLSTLLSTCSPIEISNISESSPQSPAPITWFLNLNSLNFLERFFQLPSKTLVSRMKVYALNERDLVTGHYDLQASTLGCQFLGATLDSQKFFEELLQTPPAFKKSGLHSHSVDDFSIFTSPLQEDLNFSRSLGYACTGFFKKTPDHHCNTAWQIFTPDFILGLLPHDKSSYHFVYSSGVESFNVDLLEKYFPKLSITLEPSPSHLTNFRPIRTFHRKSYRSSHLLLGDALHQVHPLAGQGLNLSLADFDVFIQQIVTKPSSSLDEIQRQIIKKRYFKNMAMQKFCEYSALWKSHRYLGPSLTSFDKSTFLKYFLFEHYQQCAFQEIKESYLL